VSELIVDPLGAEPPASPVEIPGLGPPPGAAPLPPAEPAYQGPSPEEWEQSQAELAQLREFAQRQREVFAPQQQQTQQLPDIDLFADNPTEQIANLLGHMLDQRLAPFQEWQQQQQLGEAEEVALDILEDDVARNGDFRDKERAIAAARALANLYMPEEAQRHGYGPQAAEAALFRAAADIREYEKAVAEAALNEHTNQMRTLSGAPGEPGSAYTQGTQTRTTPNYRESGMSVTDRMFGGQQQ